MTLHDAPRRALKLAIVAGARPNFIKVAPILEALRAHRGDQFDLSLSLIHTGQHYDPNMSDVFFEDLRIPHPDVNLAVGSGSHAEQTARIMVGFEGFCKAENPDWVLVVGDVNSTMACAITAKKLGIKVAHVEAGLRSHDRTMPEEINRICTDAIADLFFVTDMGAARNLRREGICGEKIHFVGNTLIDSLLRLVEEARLTPLPDGLTHGNFAVLTLHRVSNVEVPCNLAGIVAAVSDLSADFPIAFPVHPRTRKKLEELGLLEQLETQPNIRITPPLSYLNFLGLMSRARIVLTDSGGIQEETTALAIPCLTLRSNTERPITCEMGTNVLVGCNRRDIRRAALEAWAAAPASKGLPEKWDGRASQRIVDILMSCCVSREKNARRHVWRDRMKCANPKNKRNERPVA